MDKIHKRNCPDCQRELMYVTKPSIDRANKNQSLCRGCLNRKKIETSGSVGWFVKDMTGVNNPFYGKKHTEEAIKKMRQNQNRSFMQTSEYKEKMSQLSRGKDNPMYGKSFYNVWVEKYGKDKADELMLKFKEKQSINSSGKNNPMYGKPSPHGSGNGWSGWYGDFYFRSLKELSYIFDLDNKQIKWQSAEHIKIKYKSWDGHERTYRPDFLVENNLVEIKPTRLRGSKTVQLKEEAAIIYCQQHNLSYQMIDPPNLSDEDIKNLRSSGKIKFIDRYEKLFQQKYVQI